MDTINFIQQLKETLWDIETFGGNSEVRVLPNHEMLVQLRRFVLDEATQREIRFDSTDHRLTTFVDDLMDSERFERRISYCIIKLREFGISGPEYFNYISKALNIVLSHFENATKVRRSKSKGHQTLDELLVSKITRCFETWYYPSNIFNYNFVSEHNLANWNPIDRRWRLTTIGKYLLDLPAFEMIILLCALEVTFGRDGGGRRYLNLQTLTELSSPDKARSRRGLMDRLPISLNWYGITCSIRGEYTITDFGKRIIKKVNGELEPLRELVLLLMESEVSGLRSEEDSSNLSDIRQVTKQAVSLTQDQKDSIETAIGLYLQEKYLDCLRIFYNNIEAVLNFAIFELGERAEDFRGMKSKIEKLEKHKIIPTRLGTWLEVITSRNKIIHGNLIENDAQILKPLFNIVSSFWSQLLKEIEAKAI